MRGSGISQRSARPGLNVQMLIAGQQIVEEQFINPLGLRIEPHPWIEIGRAVLDDHHERVGSGLAEQEITENARDDKQTQQTTT